MSSYLLALASGGIDAATTAAPAAAEPAEL